MTGADTGVTDEVRALIRTALDEDLRYGPDITTVATIPLMRSSMAIVSRDHGVVAGVGVACRFRRGDRRGPLRSHRRTS